MIRIINTWEQAKQLLVEQLPDIPDLTAEEYYFELTTTQEAIHLALQRIERMELALDQVRSLLCRTEAPTSHKAVFRELHALVNAGRNDPPEIRTDFENLKDGDRITLHPNETNPLHRKPVLATYSAGYFYCDGTDATQGPDYYMGDVLGYNDGFSMEAGA